MLIHWPGAAHHDITDPLNAQLRLQTYRVLEDLYKAGRIRSLGVSNFTVAHLKELLAVAEVPPMVNQVGMVHLDCVHSNRDVLDRPSVLHLCTLKRNINR